jgi:hypothetical protein
MRGARYPGAKQRIGIAGLRLASRNIGIPRTRSRMILRPRISVVMPGQKRETMQRPRQSVCPEIMLKQIDEIMIRFNLIGS